MEDYCVEKRNRSIIIGHLTNSGPNVVPIFKASLGEKTVGAPTAFERVEIGTSINEILSICHSLMIMISLKIVNVYCTIL